MYSTAHAPRITNSVAVVTVPVSLLDAEALGAFTCRVRAPDDEQAGAREAAEVGWMAPAQRRTHARHTLRSVCGGGSLPWQAATYKTDLASSTIIPHTTRLLQI